MEGALLGLFMVAACGFATLLEYPASPVHEALPDGNVRRLLMGFAMGLTAIGLIYSPWGQQSGAHMNPSLTVTYFRLGKIERRDTIGYVVGQFLGGVMGVLVVRTTLGMPVADPAVCFAATVPGPGGATTAFVAEFAISFLLMSVVLVASNSLRLARYTPLLSGALVATYIILEAPISGMSMNPARSFASALAAWQWTALWIYFTAPPLGMLAAAETSRCTGHTGCCVPSSTTTRRGGVSSAATSAPSAGCRRRRDRSRTAGASRWGGGTLSQAPRVGTGPRDREAA